MDSFNSEDYSFKESGQFPTDKEIMEMDGVLLRINEEIMKKAGEIVGILGISDREVRRLREAYLQVSVLLKEKNAELDNKVNALGKEEEAKQILKEGYDLLLKKYRDLEAENEELRAELDRVNREKDKMGERLQGLEEELSGKREEYWALEAESKRIRKDYNRYYTDAREDKERAESDFKQLQAVLVKQRQEAESLQERLEKESSEKEQKAGEAENLERQLIEETDKARALKEEIRKYELQRQTMPALMRLYNAYSGILEKRNGLPQEFFDCLQSVAPLDNFDSFLLSAIRESFPVYYYLSVQSFITVCSRRGNVSGEAVKEALHVSDVLLSAVFDFGSEYFEEEKLVRIGIEAGDQFDSGLCRYIDEKGGAYGNIVKVWLHGFRDERDNQIYCSYVEGE